MNWKEGEKNVKKNKLKMQNEKTRKRPDMRVGSFYFYFFGRTLNTSKGKTVSGKH